MTHEQFAKITEALNALEYGIRMTSNPINLVDRNVTVIQGVAMQALKEQQQRCQNLEDTIDRLNAELESEAQRHADSIVERDDAEHSFTRLASALGVDVEFSNTRDYEQIVEDALAALDRLKRSKPRRKVKQ